MINGTTSPWSRMSPVEASRALAAATELMAKEQDQNSLTPESYAARDAVRELENSGAPTEIDRNFSAEMPVPTVLELMKAGGRKSGSVNSDMAKKLEELAAKSGLGVWK